MGHDKSRKKGHKKQRKQVVYVDMDGVLVHFESAFASVPVATLAEYAGREDEIPGIYGLMEPMPGAVESFRELAEHFDVYILSTAPWRNSSAWSDKVEWVQRYLGAERDDPAYKRLILSHHKDLNRGDFLIDNRTKRGADRFKGELILFGAKDYPDWPAVMRRMRKRYDKG
jgi:5'(3')-deoxyribonucleotidase